MEEADPALNLRSDDLERGAYLPESGSPHWYQGQVSQSSGFAGRRKGLEPQHRAPRIVGAQRCDLPSLLSAEIQPEGG